MLVRVRFLGVQKSSPQQIAELSAAITANDSRSILANRTFSGRTIIWHSSIVSAFREPIIIFRGLLSKQIGPTYKNVMSELYPGANYPDAMHNSFLQVFMVSGLPGLILIVAWTVLLIIKMVKIFYSKRKDIGIEVKILTLPIASLFVVSLAESLLFFSFDVSGIVFYLCAGVFLGYYYDSYPVKTKN